MTLRAFQLHCNGPFSLCTCEDNAWRPLWHTLQYYQTLKLTKHYFFFTEFDQKAVSLTPTMHLSTCRYTHTWINRIMVLSNPPLFTPLSVILSAAWPLISMTLILSAVSLCVLLCSQILFVLFISFRLHLTITILGLKWHEWLPRKSLRHRSTFIELGSMVRYRDHAVWTCSYIQVSGSTEDLSRLRESLFLTKFLLWPFFQYLRPWYWHSWRSTWSHHKQ